MKDSWITSKNISIFQFKVRYAEKVGLSLDALDEIIFDLETNWRLGRYRYSKERDRLAEFGLKVSASSLRRFFRRLKKFQELAEKTKRGGKIRGTLFSNVYRIT